MPLIRKAAEETDYFGHPRGMVPMLSFEVNYRNYEQEIDSILRMLFLSHWLELYWEASAQRKDVLNWSISHLEEEMAKQAERTKRMEAIRPSLEQEGDQLRIDIQAIIGEMKAAEKEIDEKFKKDEKLRKTAQAALRGVSTALSLGSMAGMMGNSSPPGVLDRHPKRMVGGMSLGAGAAEFGHAMLQPDAPVTTGSFSS